MKTPDRGREVLNLDSALPGATPGEKDAIARLSQEEADEVQWTPRDEDDAGRIPTSEEDDPSWHPDFGKFGD